MFATAINFMLYLNFPKCKYYHYFNIDILIVRRGLISNEKLYRTYFKPKRLFYNRNFLPFTITKCSKTVNKKIRNKNTLLKRFVHIRS